MPSVPLLHWLSSYILRARELMAAWGPGDFSESYLTPKAARTWLSTTQLKGELSPKEKGVSSDPSSARQFYVGFLAC